MILRAGNKVSSTTGTTTFLPALPDEVWTGWLGDFRRWVEPTTDGALEAIFGVASSELGLAIGRNLGIHYGRTVYANEYTQLVGRTGVPRKTTIVSRGRSIRERAFSQDEVKTTRSIGSGEGLLELFCEDSPTGGLKPNPGQKVLLDEPEFTNLLKKARRTGTANITEILLTLYDADDWTPRTRQRSIRVEQPYFSLITTTTPESLRESLQEIDIQSGLIPRFATYYCTPRVPVAYPPKPDDKMREGLGDKLRDIATYAGTLGTTQETLELTPQAKGEWERVYPEFAQEARKAPSLTGRSWSGFPYT